MEIFTFNADVGNESVDDFNQRLYDFCARPDAPVINIITAQFSGAVVLSLSTPEELPVQLPFMLVPAVRPISLVDMLTLETVLSDFAAKLSTEHSQDGDQIEAIEMRMVEAKGQKFVGYAVAILNYGEISYEDAAQAGGG